MNGLDDIVLYPRGRRSFLAYPRRTMRGPKVGALLLGMVACSGANARSREHQDASPAIDIPRPSASPVASTPTANVTPSAAASASASSQEPGPRLAKTIRETIELAAGRSCIVVLHQEPFGDFDKLAIEPGADCVAQTLFDLDAEVAADTQHKVEHEGLMHYYMQSQGSPQAGEIAYQDVDFDGFVDIQMLHHQGMGAGDYSQQVACWIYDPGSRSFSRNIEFELLPNPKLDPQKKIIGWGGRESGPYYVDGESSWINGTLEVTEQTETILGEQPDGKPLPPGQDWQIRKKRQATGLVTVFNGAVKAP
jgi:hypothetical protein